MTASKKLRRLLRNAPYLFTAGVYDAISAKWAGEAGLNLAYFSGYSFSLGRFGKSDLEFYGRHEIVETAARMAQATDVPIIADADTGYGGVVQIRELTIPEYIRAGVAGVHIEDQKSPKRCGHIAGKELVSFEEAVGKIKAAVDARNKLDPDFLIIARTDALGAVGGSMGEAIRRGSAYADAGADMVWCEFSNTSREPAITFARGMQKKHKYFPLAFNYSSSFTWHNDPNPFRFRELADLGYRYIFCTLYGILAGAYIGMVNALMDLAKREEEAVWDCERLIGGRPKHHKMGNTDYYQEMEKLYLPETAARRLAESEGFGKAGDTKEQ